MRVDSAFRSIKVICIVVCQLEKKYSVNPCIFLIYKNASIFFWLFVTNAPKRASVFRLTGSPYYVGRTMQGLVASRIVVHC